MAEVGDWKLVGVMLGVQESKLEEISQLSSSEREKRLALGDYWVNTAPDASWEIFARLLYQFREEKALAVTKQYLQQGILVAEIGIYILMDSQLPVMVIYDYRRTKRKTIFLTTEFPDHFS